MTLSTTTPPLPSASPTTLTPSTTTSYAPDIIVTNLTYTLPTVPTPLLSNLTFQLPPSSRTLLIGANGAGKTTLLRLLSGKKLAPHGRIHVGGVDPFSTGLEGVTYLGLEWVLNPIVRHDICVAELLDSVGGKVWKDRRGELVRILDVDEEWRMNCVSDGERRRVQLCMGLVRPWTVLLLDEVTVDLDVLARSRFLEFLRTETEVRACTIVYATHIMDGLSGWPTHLVRMTLGKVRQFGTVEELSQQVRMAREKADRERRERGDVEGPQVWRNSALLDLVLGWLEEDYRERGPRKPRVSGP